MASTQGNYKKTAGESTQVIDEWRTASTDAVTIGADIIPAGWCTMKDLAAAVFKKSLSTTNRRVMRMVDSGTVDSKTFRVLINGRLKVVPHYKLKSKT